jgi:hypothetical protein
MPKVSGELELRTRSLVFTASRSRGFGRQCVYVRSATHPTMPNVRCRRWASNFSGDLQLCESHDGHDLPSVARQRADAKKTLAMRALDTLAELTEPGHEERIRLQAARHLLRLAVPELIPKRAPRQKGQPEQPELETASREIDVEIEGMLGKLRELENSS